MSQNLEALRDNARREWQASPALQAEFESANAYAAFQSAIARGRVKFAPATVIRDGRPVTVSGGPAVAQAATQPTRSVGAMAALDDAAFDRLADEHHKGHLLGSFSRKPQFVDFVATTYGISASEVESRWQAWADRRRASAAARY